MITNNQSTTLSYRSRLMALPVLAFLFCTIALYAQRSSTNSVTRINFTGSAQKPITVVIDAGHGGIDPGAASTDGTVKEKDLALQISKKIQQLAPSYNINVVMTRSDDNLPANNTVISEGLKARTAIAQQAKADLFIAIHISSTGGQTDVHPDNGFEVWVSNKEGDRTKQSKQLGSAVVQELSKIYQTYPSLKQRKQNIWVLEQSPCPALLIECGFITNDKDLAFISNSSNQETIAQKILEGIANYKNKPAAAVNTPAMPVIQASKTIPAAATTPQVTGIYINDSTLNKLARHYRRNAWYPKQAKAQQAEGIVYFSVTVDKNGELGNFQAYERTPAETSQLTKLIVIGYLTADEVAAPQQLSKEETTKLLQSVMKTVSDRKPNLSGCTPQNAQYFFQVDFRLQKEQTPTV